MSENGGRANCILGVCCPGMTERQAALSADLVRDLGCTPEIASRHSAYMLKHYDLAPPGMLVPLYGEIARLAREGFTKADK